MKVDEIQRKFSFLETFGENWLTWFMAVLL